MNSVADASTSSQPAFESPTVPSVSGAAHGDHSESHSCSHSHPFIQSNPIRHSMLPFCMPMEAHWYQNEHMGTHIPNQAPSHESFPNARFQSYQHYLRSPARNGATPNADLAIESLRRHASAAPPRPYLPSLLQHHSSFVDCKSTPVSVCDSSSASSTATSSDSYDSPPVSDIKHSDLECPVCYLLLCEPITLTCGHTFCRQCVVSCLERSRKQCPVCRTACFIQPESHPKNVLLSSLIQKLYPSEYANRHQELEQVRQHWQSKLPVFLHPAPFFPNQPLVLHFFEPRYKLMVQRILPTTRKFAIIAPSADGKLHVGAVGTIFEITQFDMLLDGRVLVQAIGRSRVTVSECWVEPDTHGLEVARVSEFSDDIETSLSLTREQLIALQSHHQEPSRQQLFASTQAELHRLARMGYYDMKEMLELLPMNRARLYKTYGAMPGGFAGESACAADSPALWNEVLFLSYWLISALPLLPADKLAMLRTRCTLERLSRGVAALHGFTERLRERFQRRAAREAKLSNEPPCDNNEGPQDMQEDAQEISEIMSQSSDMSSNTYHSSASTSSADHEMI